MMNSSTFSFNKALNNDKGLGGAIYHDCTSCEAFTLINNSFNNNFADNSGGAL